MKLFALLALLGLSINANSQEVEVKGEVEVGVVAECVTLETLDARVLALTDAGMECVEALDEDGSLMSVACTMTDAITVLLMLADECEVEVEQEPAIEIEVEDLTEDSV